MDELEKLRSCEEHRIAEAVIHVVTTPILRSECLTTFILSDLLPVNLSFVSAYVCSALNNVSLALEKLLLPNLEPLLDSRAISPKILHLFYL